MPSTLPTLPASATVAHGGVFTRRQAIEAGYTSDTIAYRLRTGQWLALRRGVYTERSAARIRRAFGHPQEGAGREPAL